jgi:hypothetical protein
MRSASESGLRAPRTLIERLQQALERRAATRRERANRARRMRTRRERVLPPRERVVARLASRTGADNSDDLTTYAYKVLSQGGEDGMVHEVLRRAGFPTRRSIEIGCGANGGNSGLLAACFEYRALMLDGNPELTRIAQRLFADRAVTVRRAWITAENVNQLIAADGFLGAADYLGLDLDGIDYWIWRAVSVCDPLLVVAEYNPLFGPEAAVTIAYEPRFFRHDWRWRRGLMSEPGDGLLRVRKWPLGYWGVSLAGLVELGRQRGYRLVATSPSDTHNAFFLKEGACPELPERSPRDAWRPADKRWAAVQEAISREGPARYFEARAAPLERLD